jgi:hypothetical protein
MRIIAENRTHVANRKTDKVSPFSKQIPLIGENLDYAGDRLSQMIGLYPGLLPAMATIDNSVSGAIYHNQQPFLTRIRHNQPTTLQPPVAERRITPAPVTIGENDHFTLMAAKPTDNQPIFHHSGHDQPEHLKVTICPPDALPWQKQLERMINSMSESGTLGQSDPNMLFAYVQTEYIFGHPELNASIIADQAKSESLGQGSMAKDGGYLLTSIQAFGPRGSYSPSQQEAIRRRKQEEANKPKYQEQLSKTRKEHPDKYPDLVMDWLDIAKPDRLRALVDYFESPGSWRDDKLRNAGLSTNLDNHASLLDAAVFFLAAQGGSTGTRVFQAILDHKIPVSPDITQKAMRAYCISIPLAVSDSQAGVLTFPEVMKILNTKAHQDFRDNVSTGKEDGDTSSLFDRHIQELITARIPEEFSRRSSEIMHDLARYAVPILIDEILLRSPEIAREAILPLVKGNKREALENNTAVIKNCPYARVLCLAASLAEKTVIPRTKELVFEGYLSPHEAAFVVSSFLRNFFPPDGFVSKKDVYAEESLFLATDEFRAYPGILETALKLAMFYPSSDSENRKYHELLLALRKFSAEGRDGLADMLASIESDIDRVNNMGKEERVYSPKTRYQVWTKVLSFEEMYPEISLIADPSFARKSYSETVKKEAAREKAQEEEATGKVLQQATETQRRRLRLWPFGR